MQIVIDISEDQYNLFLMAVGSGMGDWLYKVVANGTPLPKGHGRLIDADSFVDRHDCCGYIEDMEVDYFNKVTPTIIEAEMEPDNGTT